MLRRLDRVVCKHLGGWKEVRRVLRIGYDPRSCINPTTVRRWEKPEDPAHPPLLDTGSLLLLMERLSINPVYLLRGTLPMILGTERPTSGTVYSAVRDRLATMIAQYSDVPEGWARTALNKIAGDAQIEYDLLQYYGLRVERFFQRKQTGRAADPETALADELPDPEDGSPKAPSASDADTG